MPQNQNMVILMQEASTFFSFVYANQKVKASMFLFMKHIWLINTLLYKGQQVIPLLISGCSVYVETFNLLVQGHASDVILIGTCNTLHSVIFNLGILHVTFNYMGLHVPIDTCSYLPLHSTEPSFSHIGVMSNLQTQRPSRHSVWKYLASHCSLKKHDSLTAASEKVRKENKFHLKYYYMQFISFIWGRFKLGLYTK